MSLNGRSSDSHADVPHEVEMTVYVYLTLVDSEWRVAGCMNDGRGATVHHTGCSHDHNDDILGTGPCPRFNELAVDRAVRRPPTMEELRRLPYESPASGR